MKTKNKNKVLLFNLRIIFSLGNCVVLKVILQVDILRNAPQVFHSGATRRIVLQRVMHLAKRNVVRISCLFFGFSSC